MHITAIKTDLVLPKSIKVLDLIDAHVPVVQENSVLVVSSKIISLCEGSIANPHNITKDMLAQQQSQYYIPRSASKYDSMLTITHGSLMTSAGIDESNANGMYVCWPKDPLATAWSIRTFLQQKYHVENVGVIIADSSSRPFRIGTIGLSIAHVGFKELKNYVGTKDLFNRDITLSRANIAESLATAGVLVMGEGTEQTPLAIIADVPFVEFGVYSDSCYNSPSDAYMSDLYEQVWKGVSWQKGGAP